MRAPLLALLGLLVAATPALAARYPDRGAPTGQQRAKATAPAATQAARTTRPVAATRSAAPSRPSASATRSSRPTQAAAPARGGRATHAAAPVRGSRTAQAAPSRNARWGLVSSAHARTPYAGSMTTRRGAHYAVLQGGPVCRSGARNCRIYRVSAPQPMRWSQGLSPALNVQTSNCPAGTMATLATGHSNIVRCMPI